MFQQLGLPHASGWVQLTRESSLQAGTTTQASHVKGDIGIGLSHLVIGQESMAV